MCCLFQSSSRKSLSTRPRSTRRQRETESGHTHTHCPNTGNAPARFGRSTALRTRQSSISPTPFWHGWCQSAKRSDAMASRCSCTLRPCLSTFHKRSRSARRLPSPLRASCTTRFAPSFQTSPPSVPKPRPDQVWRTRTLAKPPAPLS